jgi:hypothetical protein
MTSQNSQTPTINLTLTNGYELQKKRFSDNRWLRLKSTHVAGSRKLIKVTVFDHLRLVLKGMESPQGILSIRRKSRKSRTCEDHVSPSVSISHKKNSSRHIGNQPEKTITVSGNITNIFMMFPAQSKKKCSCLFYLDLSGVISIMTIKQRFYFTLQD